MHSSRVRVGGVSAQGDCVRPGGGCVCPGGSSIPPHPREQNTDTCENITLPQLRLRMVMTATLVYSFKSPLAS